MHVHGYQTVYVEVICLTFYLVLRWGLTTAAYAKLADSNTSGVFPVSAFHLPVSDAKVTNAHTVHLDFTWVLKIQTQILQFVQQLFYFLNQRLSPLLTTLNCINDQFVSVFWKYNLIFKILGCIKLISTLDFSYKSKCIFKCSLVVVYLHRCDAELVYASLFNTSKGIVPFHRNPIHGAVEMA